MRRRHPLHDVLNLMVAMWIYPHSIDGKTITFDMLEPDELKLLESKLPPGYCAGPHCGNTIRVYKPVELKPGIPNPYR